MRSYKYLFVVILPVLLVLQVAALRSLPYSSSLIDVSDPALAESSPTPEGFRVGSLVWDRRAFSTDPSLKPYRKVYRQFGQGLTGVAAAVRISEEFARRYSDGEQLFEIFDVQYDPVAALYMHLGGADGHCVSRAGLTATTLLAVDIPARVLQVLPSDRGGHNIIEVWDGARGWVVFDPTTGVVFETLAHADVTSHSLSAAQLIRSQGDFVIQRVSNPSSSGRNYARFFTPNLSNSSFLYPEPWLYTRVGPKASSWPFRGRFVRIGGSDWRLGQWQFILRGGILMSAAGVALFSLRGIRRPHPAVAFATGVAFALLPSWLKIPLYRLLFDFRIGKGVRIGVTPFVGIRQCRIGDHVKIGSFNLFYRVGELEIGDHTHIKFLNLFRGGQSIRIGRYSDILRQNTFNSIIEQDFIAPVVSTLDVGTGAVITSGHWLDFSAGLQIGDHAIIGGRNSSFWTHNRQRGRPVIIGNRCYLGSEVRAAPGTEVAPFCVVAMGSVLSGRLGPAGSMIGGNPATVVRALKQADLFLVTHKTRRDIPEDFEPPQLPKNLQMLAIGGATVVESDSREKTTHCEHPAEGETCVSSRVHST